MKYSNIESELSRTNDEYKNLLEYLQDERGIKLSVYRESYIARRIASRMNATGSCSLVDYIRLLEGNRKELNKLYNVLTINVSSFFRNMEVFVFLKTHIFPEIVRSKLKSGEKDINIWSIGCSTGEEPYSIAILAYRDLRLKLKNFHTVIKAVDIELEALDIAKSGVYPIDKLENLDPKTIRSCFNRIDEKFQIIETIRGMVDFERQDLGKFEPVETVFDLILCRNMLIYFNEKNHFKAYDYFLRHLHTGGYLILGKAESMLFPKKNNFNYVSVKNRVYQKFS